MNISAIDRLLGINKRALGINIILIANAFIWYTFAFKYLFNTLQLPEFKNQLLSIITVHFIGLFVALLIGEFFSRKIKNRMTFLLLWMFAGILLSIIPVFAGITYLGMVLFSVITGVNFGFGIPLCLGYFASTTEASNRGKSGGIIFLLSGIGAALMILGIGNESFLIVCLALTVWRAFGFLPLLLVKSSVKPLPSRTIFSYKEILSNRTFFLYFVPWFMFLIINSLSVPINIRFFGSDLVQYSSNIEFILGGLSAVIFGFFADSKGRKRLAVIGFAMLGLGYGILAFTGEFGASGTNLIAWSFYTIVDGVTWGSLVMIFVFALWGDIAEGRGSEKIYAIAIIPYLLSAFIRISLGEYLANLMAAGGTTGTIFSLFSFFLFIAVLPLVIAPETLSEQTIKNKDLKSYIDKAQKQVSKVKEKMPESEDKNNSKSDSEEQSDEYKKAQELAEKYY